MTLLTLEGRGIRLDRDGCLAALDDWSKSVAEALAVREELAPTAKHWEILQLLREFYAEFQPSPADRPLIKYVTRRLGPGKGNSPYFNHLLKSAPAKLGVKLIDLPKPGNCL